MSGLRRLRWLGVFGVIAASVLLAGADRNVAAQAPVDTIAVDFAIDGNGTTDVGAIATDLSLAVGQTATVHVVVHESAKVFDTFLVEVTYDGARLSIPPEPDSDAHVISTLTGGIPFGAITQYTPGESDGSFEIQAANTGATNPATSGVLFSFPIRAEAAGVAEISIAPIPGEAGMLASPLDPLGFDPANVLAGTVTITEPPGSATAASVDLDVSGNTGSVVDVVDAAATIAPGGTIVADLTVEGAVSVSGFNIQVDYDPAVLNLTSIVSDADTGFLSTGGAALPLHSGMDGGMTPPDTDGTFAVTGAQLDPANAVDGEGFLIRLEFTAVGPGVSSIMLAKGAAATGMFSDETGMAAGEFDPDTINAGTVTVLASSGSVAEASVDLDVTGNTATALGPTDASASIATSDSLVVDLTVRGAVDVSGFNIQVDYDPAVLNLTAIVAPGSLGFLSSGGGSVLASAGDLDGGTSPPDSDGNFFVAALVGPPSAAPSGDGFLVRLEFTAVGVGVSPITIAKGQAASGMFSDPSGLAANEFDADVTNAAMVTVAALNTPPDAVDDGSLATPLAVLEDAPAALPVRDNDTDAEDLTSALLITGTTDGVHGVVTPGPGANEVTYTPTSATQGALAEGETLPDQFTYTLEDSGGLSDTALVFVEITGVNDDPVVANAIPNQTAAEGAPFAFAVPAGTFTDADASDVLTLTATRGDDTALPAWLTFAGGAFSGTPGAGDTGVLTVKVTADDGHGGAVATTFDIEVIANLTPVAEAGPPQTVASGALVTLDGSASADPDAGPSPLTFSWTLLDPGGADQTVLLAGADTATPSFTPVAPGAWVATLTVDDGLASATDAVTVTVNTTPVAEAGPPQTVASGALVTLDGSASVDPDAGPSPLTFSWTLLDPGGADQTVLLAGAGTDMPMFLPTAPGNWVATLTVDDGLASATDTVTITVNTTPVAEAGPPQTVASGALVTLDGSASADPDAGPSPLTFSWTLLDSGGADQTGLLTAADTATPSFTPVEPGAWVATLTVDDGLASATDTVTITVNTPPVAEAGPAQTVASGVVVTLDGSASVDPDAGPSPLTFSWTLLDPGGADQTVLLAGAGTDMPTFLPTAPGDWVATLTVDDGLASATDTVMITVNTPPVADAGADQTVFLGEVVTLNGLPSNDPDSVLGGPLSFAWTLTDPDALDRTALLSDATVVQPTFTPDKLGEWTASLVVNDGVEDSAPDSTTLTVLAAPSAASVAIDLDVAGNTDATTVVLPPDDVITVAVGATFTIDLVVEDAQGLLGFDLALSHPGTVRVLSVTNYVDTFGLVPDAIDTGGVAALGNVPPTPEPSASLVFGPIQAADLDGSPYSGNGVLARIELEAIAVSPGGQLTLVAGENMDGNLLIGPTGMTFFDALGAAAATVNVIPAPTAHLASTSPAAITEATLDTATVTITIDGDVFVASPVAGDFDLPGAPAGVSVAGVTRDSDTQATLTLAFDGTDFDAFPSIQVTALSTALAAGAPATTEERFTVRPIVEGDTLDTDDDGFPDELELYLGTDPMSGCGPGAWPPDVTDNAVVNVLDVFELLPLGRAFGDVDFDPRLDFTGNGVINTLDVFEMLPLSQTCT